MIDSVSMTPREKRAARTRQAILDAAREIITERGAASLSLREVARRIDYSPAGLYEYFSGKDELIEAVVAEGFSRFSDALLSIPRELEPLDYLLRLGKAYVQFAVDNPSHFMLVFTNSTIYQRRDDEDCDDDYISDGTFQTLMFGLQRAIDAGLLPETLDLTEASYGAWSVVHGMAILRVTQLNQSKHDWEAATDSVLRHWFLGLTMG